MSKQCPACGFDGVVLAHGDDDTEILFIGSSPSDDELHYHRPFVGNVAHIFKRELFKYAHIDLPATRQVLLWWHPKPTTKKQGDCFLVSFEQVSYEMAGKSRIILVGADAVKYFTGLGVDDVNGFDVTNEILYPVEEGVKYFALVNPTSVYRSLGEFRFGLDQLGLWMVEK